MIIDTLENLENYVSLNPLFKEVVAFIKANDLTKLEAGKHFIKDKDLFVNIQLAKGKTKEEAVMETHRNMIDIQIPLMNDETFGYTPLSQLPDIPYNDEKDITKYPTTVPVSGYVTCKKGMFALFFPQDGHAPCIAETDIPKAIFKVKA